MNSFEKIGKAMMDNMMSMMEMPETTGSTDKDFANMMIKHHTDGIPLGETILKYTENQTFKSMTEKINTDQKKELLDFFWGFGRHSLFEI